MSDIATDYAPLFAPSEAEVLPQPAAEMTGPLIGPNYFPPSPSARRIAVIGEACSAGDIEKGRPFTGAAGALLSQFLNSVGIDRDSCFLGNVCQQRAPGGKAAFLKWNSAAIQDGLKQLGLDLAVFKPDFCLLLGTLPLKAMSGEHRTIGNWRGSLFESDALLPGVKCMAVYHPDSVQIDYGLTGVCRFDYARAAREARTGWTAPPTDRIEIDLGLTQLLLRLSLVLQRKQHVALDIEGYCSGISCIGFATSPNDAFVVPFSRQDGTSYWDEATEIMLWEAVAAVLESTDVPKVLHNALYELFCLGWYGVCIRNISDDTMMLAHELHAELEKSLGFIASIYTSHFYWKGERKTLDDRVALLYNGKDCCRTFECWQAMLPKLKPAQLSHYRTNVACLAPTAYMMLRGMAFDKAAAKLRLKANKQSIYEKQDAINQSVLEAAGLFLDREQTASDSSAQETAAGSADAKVNSFSADSRVQRIRELYQAISGHGRSIARTGLARAVTHADGNTGLTEAQTNSPSKAGAKVDERLVAILTAAFCKARYTEPREVEEPKWQPMRFNGKRYVKAGKQVKDLPAGLAEWQDEYGNCWRDGDILWTPQVKAYWRNVPVAIASLADVRRFARDSAKRSCRRACAITKKLLAGNSERLPVLRGELSTLLNSHINVGSTGQEGDAAWLLYQAWQLPKQYQKEGNRLTTKLATDNSALLAAWVDTGGKDDRCLQFLELRGLLKQKDYLSALPDDDGRIRYSLNLVATPTGRMACYGSPTSTSKLNMQTIGKKLRDLFPADGVIIQTDLEGSDSWTVAAYCASLGDRTMLDDLLARIKCAKVLALIYERGHDINALPREELRKLMKEVDSEGWLYAGCKGATHGSSYGMKGAGVSKKLVKDSYRISGKPIYVTPAICIKLQDSAFFMRYSGVRQWHDWMKRQLTAHGKLIAFNGFQRQFYGRKKDTATQREALATMPQIITTWAIKLALLSMWTDPENRRSDGTLRVEPLLCVHDSIVKQCQPVDIEFARVAVKRWFNHEMTVNGIKFVIPANSTGGPDWLHQGADKYGAQGGFDL